MLVLCRSFRHSFKNNPLPDAARHPDPATESSISSSSDPEKDLAVVVWWAAFGISLFFQPAAEVAIRFVFFAVCALLAGALDGFLSLLIGHAVLKAASCDGYERSITSSMEAGALGGISVIGPIIVLTVLLVAMLGNTERHSFTFECAAFLMEIAIIVAVSAAACPVGVVVVRHTQMNKGPTLDAAHAAQAGALGASIVTVPIVSIAAFCMREAKALSARKNASTPSMHLADSGSMLPHPIFNQGSTTGTQRHRRLDAHTAVRIVYYMLVILCILAIRLLCF
ncbi:hypothetical protein PAXRUDRAFT_825950 [Paxillus rubicundulus Ve08.2h10]|uniref:Uncharacterized protein n=1 Tax=Paxillus rubicundulus Ve08.2h10 TaxID=930991 RepID=A0A0D0E554_9AGAM|nr:hypothetical protein PAXRUDRAFT_825950 [Paxillus rubicundulus Ve08.2h10]